MAVLTDWELDHLKAINLLLKKAEMAKKDLAQKEEHLCSSRKADTSENWLTFRGMMLDLYSVLDYTFFLLHCHFSNKGQADLTPNAIHLGFPYKPTVVKTQVAGRQKEVNCMRENGAPLG